MNIYTCEFAKLNFFFLKVTNECYTKYKLPISVLVILYFYFICIICKVTRIEKKKMKMILVNGIYFCTTCNVSLFQCHIILCMICLLAV